MLLTVVMVNNAEATTRVVLLKRNSKYCKYYTLFLVVAVLAVLVVFVVFYFFAFVLMFTYTMYTHIQKTHTARQRVACIIEHCTYAML